MRRFASTAFFPASARVSIVPPRSRFSISSPIEFSETDAPGGVVTLAFSGGGALRLEVECLEVEVVDLGPVWQTTCCPEHKTIDGEIARA